MTLSDTQGARMDDLELEAAGYQRAMPRRFSFWALAAMSFDLTSTWLGTGAAIGIALTEAGPAGALWSLVIAGVMTMIVSAGMAELASAQYYWSFMVSSEKHKPFASYVNGWMSIIGWWLASASVANFIASMILEIVALWYPNYEIHNWHAYLIYVTLTWISVAGNVFGSAWIPAFNKLIFVVAVSTLSSTMLTLFIVGRNNHAEASFIFTNTTSYTGWSSNGWSFMLAIGNAVYSFLGSDCSAHLCEEIANPAKMVPRVILWPLVMGLATTFPFVVSLMYSITDLDAVFNTTAGLPIIEIYYQATGSRVAASILLAAFTFCFFGTLVAIATTSSRTLWAVSRDGALPYSHLWAHVHTKYEMPANAMMLSATFITLYGLIFLGSTTAFSAMVSTCIVFLQTSCVLPLAILLYRGRDRVLPARHFNLGRLGAPINAIAIAWVAFLDILYCFPTTLPVTPQNMSYVSVVVAGLLIFIITLWFTTKKGVFTGPKIDMVLLTERRNAALEAEVISAVEVSAKSDLDGDDHSAKGDKTLSV